MRISYGALRSLIAEELKSAAVLTYDRKNDRFDVVHNGRRVDSIDMGSVSCGSRAKRFVENALKIIAGENNFTLVESRQLGIRRTDVALFDASKLLAESGYAESRAKSWFAEDEIYRMDLLSGEDLDDLRHAGFKRVLPGGVYYNPVIWTLLTQEQANAEPESIKRHGLYFIRKSA